MKIRLTLTVVSEYDYDPEHYTDGMTLNEVLAHDKEAAEDDIGIILGAAESISITAEAVQ